MVNSQTALDCAIGATTEATADTNVRKTVVFPQKNYLSGTPKKAELHNQSSFVFSSLISV